MKRDDVAGLDLRPSSCAGLTRASTAFSLPLHHVDGRVSPFGRPGHDDYGIGIDGDLE
jgi:hypothetical protein